MGVAIGSDRSDVLADENMAQRAPRNGIERLAHRTRDRTTFLMAEDGRTFRHVVGPAFSRRPPTRRVGVPRRHQFSERADPARYITPNAEIDSNRVFSYPVVLLVTTLAGLAPHHVVRRIGRTINRQYLYD